MNTSITRRLFIAAALAASTTAFAQAPSGERFIVVPEHVGAIVNSAKPGRATVVRACDRFFVVETDRSAARFPAPAERRLRLAVDRDAMLESTAG